MRRVLLALLLLPVFAFAENHDINNMSRKAATGLAPTDGDSINPSVSGDGSYVAFSSDASDVVSDDDDAFSDVFLVNRLTPTPIPVRISKDFNGNDTNGDNDQPNVSNDGDVVVFRSSASDLVSGVGSLATPQIYLYNRISTPTPRPTPVGTVGAYALISASSSGVAGNGASFSPKASDNGDYVVFASHAKNLAADCISGEDSQIFLFDASNGSTPLTCISKNSGTQGNDNSYAPAISKDGNLIVYESTATNLTGLDTQGKKNIFLYNRTGGTTTLISSSILSGAADGDSSNPHINADGTFIVFDTNATNIVDNCPNTGEYRAVILYQISGGTKSCASIKPDGFVCAGNSIKPVLSGDASTIAYLSDCTSLVVPEVKKTPGTGLYEVYRFVRGTPTITRENTTVGQKQATPGADNPAINTDGKIIAFDTAAKLRPNDTNGRTDVYVTDADCNTDSDGDSTVDCSDECFLDPAKVSGGTCGCGTADNDSDGDSVLDCLDECPSDATKSTRGACGCGTPDTDADSNSVADCLEPTTTTVPPSLAVQKNVAAGKVTLSVIDTYRNRGYRFTYELLNKNKRIIAKKTTTATRAKFSGLRRGTYYARFRLVNGLGKRTSYSNIQRIRFSR